MNGMAEMNPWLESLGWFLVSRTIQDYNPVDSGSLPVSFRQLLHTARVRRRIRLSGVRPMNSVNRFLFLHPRTR